MSPPQSTDSLGLVNSRWKILKWKKKCISFRRKQTFLLLLFLRQHSVAIAYTVLDIKSHLEGAGQMSRQSRALIALQENLG